MKQCPECRLVYPNDSTFCFVEGASLAALPDPRIGSTVAGRYVIESELGVGGMATVYRARSLIVDRPCAIKILSGQFAQDPVLRERFVREAKHAQRIAHPNVIEIFDHGELSSAVHATCAYPGLFRAVRHEGSLYWDGGIVDKAPVLALSESQAGRELDAYLVHYLPSRTRDRLGGALAYAQGMDAGLSAGRREHFELQLKVLQARGVPVYVIVSRLPPVSPRTMERAGAEAMAAAHQSVLKALDAPPVEFSAG